MCNKWSRHDTNVNYQHFSLVRCMLMKAIIMIYHKRKKKNRILELYTGPYVLVFQLSKT